MLHYRKTFIALLIACISCSVHAQENPKYDKETEDKIKQVENNLSGWVQIEDSMNTWNLQQRMAHYKIPGLSIAVVHNGKIEWARGYGVMDTATQKPVTVQTLFQIDLHTDINTYLHTWKFPYDSLSKGKKITIANLLSHTAGLTIHGFPGYKRSDTLPSIPQILDGKRPANTEPLRSQFAPGLRSEYSGGGITILQMIVIDVTHEPYDTYMWNNVLKPLGMTMSFYTQSPSKDREKFLATGYRQDGKEVEEKFHVYPEQAAAGLWTNPTDLAKYIIETQLSLLGKSNKVLSQEMTKLRLTPYMDSSAALGVFIDKKGNEKYFQRGGANEGFRCQYYGSFENGNGVVVMVNSDNGGILNEVINSVAGVYGWKDFYKQIVKKVINIPDSLMNAYEGNYILNRDTINISKKGDEVVLAVNRNETHTIYFSSPEEFFSKEIPLEFKFEKDKDGKVQDFYFKQGEQELRAKRL